MTQPAASSDSSSRFTASIPAFYDRYFGPAVFKPYAHDLARRIAETAGSAVLETACGTGILTRELRASLPSTTSLTATDLNQPMIDQARAMLDGISGIEWQVADCASLPFPDASFTALACQFGFMFIPDKLAAFREARRVLTDGGLLAFNVWDTLAHNPYTEVVQTTIAGCFPENPPTFFKIPFGFNDVGTLKALLDQSGFIEHAINVVSLELHSPSAEAMALALVRGTPMSNAIQERGGDFAAIVTAVEAALAQHGGKAPFRSTMQALVVTARAG